jgi:hypothetical protein
MGWKNVRDRNEAWSRAHGISGQWRICQDPVAGLTKKLLEEIAEWLECRDRAELYDVSDVLNALLRLGLPDDVTAEGGPVQEAGTSLLTAAAPWVERGDIRGLLAVKAVLGYLIPVSDPLGAAAYSHDRKVEVFGGFTGHIEWTPLPAGTEDWRP